MRKNVFRFSVFLMAVSLLAGCATIISKSSYPVSIDTRPEGAQVSITDKKGKEVYKGRSPSTVVLKSGAGFFSRAEYQVRLSAPGYAEQVIPVNYKLNAWYFGNLLIGGWLGMLIIDPATGAMWKLETPPIDVTLQRISAPTGATLKVMELKDVPESLKTQLVRVK